MTNDSAQPWSVVLFHVPAAYVRLCFPHIKRFKGSWQSSGFWGVFLSVSVSHSSHSPNRHTHGAAVSDRMHSNNTTGCCRVDVGGVKVHTSHDKQNLFLRTNYSLFMSVIDAASLLTIPCFLNSCQRLVARHPHTFLSVIHFSLVTPVFADNDKTIWKQKDNQTDSPYLPCCRFYTTNKGIHNIVWCRTSQFEYVLGPTILFIPAFLQHLSITIHWHLCRTARWAHWISWFIQRQTLSDIMIMSS